MAEGTEPIREEIAAIRGSMSETLERLETRVRVDVEDRVEQVREQFDWRHWVERQPLAALGLALAVGFWLGRR